MTALPAPGLRGRKGWARGRHTVVPVPQPFRGTTVQVCGMNPWVIGSGSPMVGVPLGRVITGGGTGLGATVCGDPISWFERGHLIDNPSMFILGLPGKGKSSLARRIVLGCTAQGILPLVLSDLKPDYVALIRALGGQVIQLGVGVGYVNILDMGDAIAAADRLREAGHAGAADGLLAAAKERRQTGVESLLTVERGVEPAEIERSLLAAMLRVLDTSWARGRRKAPPILANLLAVLVKAQSAPATDPIRVAALDRGDLDTFMRVTEPLERTLSSLVQGNGLGALFNRATTVTMRRDSPVVFDISAIPEEDTKRRAAVMIACWSYGFGQIAVTHALSDAGLEPAQRYLVVIDELWNALRAGTGLVDRVDSLTRTNRTKGVGTIFLSHTMEDLKALPAEEDRAKAAGFVDRAGMVVLFALPMSEMPRLEGVVKLAGAEQRLLSSWATPQSWTAASSAADSHPGRGNCLIKVGERPGIPIKIIMPPEEQRLGDTNQRWANSVNAPTLVKA